MLKVGIIGCGGIGAVHARCWAAMGDQVLLTAVADTDMIKARKCVEGIDARVYQDGYALLEQEDLDIIDICVPTFLHTDYCIKAMERVSNVIVEKPVCLNEREAQALLEAQNRTGAFVQVAHVVRFMEPYRFLKELVVSGQYGQVVAGSFQRISPRPNWMRGHDDINKTGTMTVDMHIHDADFICYLMDGKPEQIKVQSVKDREGIIQHIWTSYQFGTATLLAEGSWDYPEGFPFKQTFRVKFEKAAVVLSADGVVTVYPEKGEAWIPELSEKKEMDMGINVSDIAPYMKEIQYFIDAILADTKQSIVSLEEAISSFRLVWKELELAQNNT